MAGKKAKSEIDGIRAELRTLAEAVWALRNQVSFEAATAAANGHTNLPIRPVTDPIVADGRGVVTTRGVVHTADDDLEVGWDLEVSVDTLLAADHEGAAKVLAAIGHPQRLAIIKTLLDGPTTAAALVTELDLGTTGAAYHHLNVLQGAGLVAQASRGIFELPGERAGTILTILVGLATTAVPTSADDDADEPSGKKRRRKPD